MYSKSLSASDNKHVILSPGYMGPKALPVKKVGRVSIDNKIYFDFSLVSSWQADEELSFNPQLDFFIPWQEFAALIIKIEPFEYYRTSESIRDFRQAQNKQGLSKGDIYFGASFSIYKSRKKDLSLVFNLLTKTTSGKKVEDARHTNSPGYLFDLSFKKEIKSSIFLIPNELSGYLGFFAWQTNKAEQNDAFCGAIKTSYKIKDMSLNFELGAYSGWQNNKDRPIVLSLELVKHFNVIDLFGVYDFGLRDRIAHSLAFGFSRKFF